MRLAAEEAVIGVRRGDGGPFGALIVRHGRLIARGHNQVVRSSDPTNHAEVVAIRKACRRLHRFDLSDCVLITSCEPCPMCLSIAYWAKLPLVYYGATQKDAAAVGFDDAEIYRVLRGEERGKVRLIQANREPCLRAFRLWVAKSDRVQY